MGNFRGSACSLFLAGIIWCITIIGIPVGLQIFKLAEMTFAPFGSDFIPDPNKAKRKENKPVAKTAANKKKETKKNKK